MQTQDGDIEGAAPQIVNRDHPFLTGVKAIGDRGRGRLVEQTQYVQTGQTGRILGALTLGIIEIGGHGNDHAIEIAPECLGATLGQLFENFGRDLHRIDQPLTGLQLRHAIVGGNKLVRLLAGIDIGQRLAHHPFDRDDGVVRIERRFALGINPHSNGDGSRSRPCSSQRVSA